MLVHEKQKENARKPILESSFSNCIVTLCLHNEYEQCEGNLITFALFMLVLADSKNVILRMHGLVGSVAWPVTKLGWLGPAQPYRPAYLKKKKEKENFLQKLFFFLKVIFPCIFLLNFA